MFWSLPRFAWLRVSSAEMIQNCWLIELWNQISCTFSALPKCNRAETDRLTRYQLISKWHWLELDLLRTADPGLGVIVPPGSIAKSDRVWKWNSCHSIRSGSSSGLMNLFAGLSINITRCIEYVCNMSIESPVNTHLFLPLFTCSNCMTTLEERERVPAKLN